MKWRRRNGRFESSSTTAMDWGYRSKEAETTACPLLSGEFPVSSFYVTHVSRHSRTRSGRRNEVIYALFQQNLQRYGSWSDGRTVSRRRHRVCEWGEPFGCISWWSRESPEESRSSRRSASAVPKRRRVAQREHRRERRVGRWYSRESPDDRTETRLCSTSRDRCRRRKQDSGDAQSVGTVLVSDEVLEQWRSRRMVWSLACVHDVSSNSGTGSSKHNAWEQSTGPPYGLGGRAGVGERDIYVETQVYDPHQQRDPILRSSSTTESWVGGASISPTVGGDEGSADEFTKRSSDQGTNGRDIVPDANRDATGSQDAYYSCRDPCGTGQMGTSNRDWGIWSVSGHVTSLRAVPLEGRILRVDSQFG